MRQQKQTAHDLAVKVLHFSLEYLQSQVTKCRKLANIGEGPDALKSAAIAKAGVILLAKKVEVLLDQLELGNVEQDFLLSLVRDFHFYLNKEQLRMHVVFTTAPIEVHKGMTQRIPDQLATIETFFLSLETLYNNTLSRVVLPVDEPQKRCDQATIEITHNLLIALSTKREGQQQREGFSLLVQKNIKHFEGEGRMKI